MHQPIKYICAAMVAISAGGCAQKNDAHVILNAAQYCAGWRHITIRKADKLTEETAAQIEGNNKARPAWGCQYGESRAKGAGA